MAYKSGTHELGNTRSPTLHAHTHTALLLKDGRGIARDEATAVAYMRRAVHADHQAARIALGTMMIEVCVAVCCGVLLCVAVCCRSCAHCAWHDDD